MSKPVRQSSPRIAWIDLAETIAIMLVILCHVIHRLISISTPVTATHPSFYVSFFFRTVPVFGVPLFFIVNGYLLFSKKFDYRKHFRKLFKYLSLAIFWWIITVAFMAVDVPCTSLTNFVSNFLAFSGGEYHFWFMGALIGIYLFFPFLKYLYDYNLKLFYYFVAICFFFTFGNFFLNNFLTLATGEITIDTNIFGMYNPFGGRYNYTLVYFCCGGIIHHFTHQITQIPAKKRNLIAILGLAIGFLGVYLIGVMYSHLQGSIWDYPWQGYQTIFALVGSLSAFILCLNWQRPSRFLGLVSQNTLGLYFIHTFPLFLLFHRELDISTAGLIFEVIFATLIVFIISLAVVLLISKTFLRRLIK